MKAAPRLLAALAVVAVLTPVPRSMAQEGDQVTLTLVAQSPWNSPTHPMLNLKVNAVNNGGADLEELSLAITLFEPLPTRSDYQLSLTEDVGVPIAPTYTELSDTPLVAGSSQVLDFRADVSFLVRHAPEARVFPLKVELLSGNQHVAELRTPVVFLPAKPKEPLNLVWTYVIGHPVAFGPDGVFLSDELAVLVGPGGALSSEVSALRSMLTGKGASPVNVSASPTLIEDLVRMQDGYRVATPAGTRTVDEAEEGAASARSVLGALKTIASIQKVELSAMPYGVPDLAQLARSGLGGDIPLQVQFAGASPAALETRGDPEVLRPPGSSFDEASLRVLGDQGVKALLVDGGVVQQPRQEKGFAPPMAAVLSSGPAPTPIAIVPDEGLQGVITSSVARDDPRLAVQILLGDLASIWQEQPDESRAVAMTITTEQELPASLFDPLVRIISSVPWIRTMKASQAAVHFPPDPEPAKFQGSKVPAISARYLAQIEEDRGLIAEWVSILADPADADSQRKSLTGQLLLAEGSYLVAHEHLGSAWLRSIKDGLLERFAAVAADTQQEVTLTASGGRIPIRVTNNSDHDLRVRLELISSRLRFATGNTREISLAGGQTKVFVFDAAAQTTGTFPVKVAIETPSGQQLSEVAVTVRSTAYNRVALTVTIAAMAVLLFAWARRSRSQKNIQHPKS